MGGVSAGANLMAVTSLAFQLAHSTQKVFDFWDQSNMLQNVFARSRWTSDSCQKCLSLLPLKDAMVDLCDLVALELRLVLFQQSAWTKGTLLEPFSQDLERFTLARDATSIYAFYASVPHIIVQPSRMLTLRATVVGHPPKDVRYIIDSSSMSLASNRDVCHETS